MDKKVMKHFLVLCCCFALVTPMAIWSATPASKTATGHDDGASVADGATDGSALAKKLAAHFSGKRVEYTFKGSASEPPMDVSVLVCPDGSFVYHDRLAERKGNLGGGRGVRSGNWRIVSRSGHGIVELAFGDGEVTQHDAMVRSGQTYVDGERVHLSSDASRCKGASVRVQHTRDAEPAPVLGQNGDWDAFLKAFRAAVHSRDRIKLQGMMSPSFDYANDVAVPPQRVFKELDFNGGANWVILERTLSRPVKPFTPMGAAHPSLSAFHPAPCGEGCRYQSELVFELDSSSHWRWKAMVFPGD